MLYFKRNTARIVDRGCGMPAELSLTFQFTEEQEVIRRSVREFADNELRPHVMEWEEAQRFPAEILPKLAALGLMGVAVPAEYGGAGLGYTEYAIVIEELSRVDGSVGIM